MVPKPVAIIVYPTTTFGLVIPSYQRIFIGKDIEERPPCAYPAHTFAPLAECYRTSYTHAIDIYYLKYIRLCGGVVLPVSRILVPKYIAGRVVQVQNTRLVHTSREAGKRTNQLVKSRCIV